MKNSKIDKFFLTVSKSKKPEKKYSSIIDPKRNYCSGVIIDRIEYFDNFKIPNDSELVDYQGYNIKFKFTTESLGMYIENGTECCELVGGFVRFPNDIDTTSIEINHLFKSKDFVIKNVFWGNDVYNDNSDRSESFINIDTNYGILKIGVYNTNSYYKHCVYTHFHDYANIHKL